MRRRLARFNRRVANRPMRVLARHVPPLALIHHVGRRSGARYATPVVLLREGDRWVVALIYGRDTDWVRNVLAAGRCDIERRGRIRHVRRVEIVEAEADDLAIPAIVRQGARRAGVRAFLRLEAASGAGDGSRPNG